MIRIGTWLVNPETCTISGRDEVKKLSPRAMDVLVCLAESAPGVVSVECLLDRFWTAHSSSDHAVHKVLATLRRAFDDSPTAPDYIKTFPKRGYAIIADVEFLTDQSGDSEEPESLQRFSAPGRNIELSFPAAIVSAFAIFLVMLALVFDSGRQVSEDEQHKIVAINSPEFIALDDDSSGLYLSSGFYSALVSNLSQLTGMSIVQLESDPTPRIAMASASELDATHLLQSRIVETADHYALNLELLELEKGTTIYSEEFTLEPSNLLTTQDQVTDNVVESLRIYLDDDQREAMHDWGTANALAYKHFLKAEFFKEQWNHDDWRMALTHYEKAIELDPDFVNAYSGLATAGNYLAIYSSQSTATEMNNMLQEYARKLALEKPGHPAVETLKSTALNSGGQLSELAAIYSSRIINGNAPKYVFAQYGLYLQGARLYAEAEQFFRIARSESPYQTSPNQQVNFSVASMPPWSQIAAGKKRLYEQPRHIGILGLIIKSSALMGNEEETEFYFQQQASVDKEGIRTHLSKIYLSAASGELFALANLGDNVNELSAKFDARFPELFFQENLDHPDLQFNNGIMKLILGDISSAASHFRKLNTIDRRSIVTRLHSAEILFPDSVLENPAYHGLLEELGFGLSWQRQLMREIKDMQAVTGIKLSAQAEQAFNENDFISRNTLWDSSQWTQLADQKKTFLESLAGQSTILHAGTSSQSSSF